MKPTVNQRMSAVLGIARRTISAMQPDDDAQVITLTTPTPTLGCESALTTTQPGGAVALTPAPVEVISSADHNEDVVTDYEFVRKTTYRLIERANEALDHLLPLAKESESPRGYEVTHMLLKTTSEMAKDLIDLHRLMNEVQAINGKKVIPEGGVTNIQNNIAFVGTTSELQRIARKAMLNKAD